MSINVVKIECLDKDGNPLDFLMSAPGEYLDEIAYNGDTYDGLQFTVRITDTQAQDPTINATVTSWDAEGEKVKESRDMTLSGAGGDTYESTSILLYSGRIKDSTRQYFEGAGLTVMPSSALLIEYLWAIYEIFAPVIRIEDVQGADQDGVSRPMAFGRDKMYVGNNGLTPPGAEAPSIIVFARVLRPDLLQGEKVYWWWEDPPEESGHVPDEDGADGDNKGTAPPQWFKPSPFLNFDPTDNSSVPDADGWVAVQFTGTTYGGDNEYEFLRRAAAVKDSG